MKKNLFLFSLSLILIFTGCLTSSKKDVTNNIDIKINESNLGIDYLINKNDELIVYVTNNSNETINYLIIDIAFFDSDNNLIKVEKEYIHNALAGSVSYSKTNIVNDDKPVSKIEIALNKEVYEVDEKIYTNQVIGTLTSIEEGKLNLNIENNSGVVLDEVLATIIFYKDNQIIDIFPTTLLNVEMSASQEIPVPIYKDGESYFYIDYDNYKVVINNASIFNNE